MEFSVYLIERVGIDERAEIVDGPYVGMPAALDRRAELERGDPENYYIVAEYTADSSACTRRVAFTVVQADDFRAGRRPRWPKQPPA